MKNLKRMTVTRLAENYLVVSREELSSVLGGGESSPSLP